MKRVPTCSTGDLTTVTLTHGGQMLLAATDIREHVTKETRVIRWFIANQIIYPQLMPADPELILTFGIHNLHFWFLTLFKGGTRQGWKRARGLLFFWLCDFTLFWPTVPLRVIASRRAPFLLFLFRLGLLPLLSCSTPLVTAWAVPLLLPLGWFVSTVFRRVFSPWRNIWTGRSSPQLSWFRYRLLVGRVGRVLFHLYIIKFRFLSLHGQR